ncbi:MAG: molybdopterin-dependent oxidoreductase, partial [bacterium]
EKPAASRKVLFKATVNKKPVALEVEADKTLLDVLREDLDLTGAKKGCDIGVCGSCVVIMNGKAHEACIEKIEECQGATIQTVEGLADNGHLHPIQEGFMKCHGYQCGICTSGFLMSGKALLDECPIPTEEQIEKAIKRNICRCTGYEQLIESVKYAAGQIKDLVLDESKFRIARYTDEDFEKIPWAKWRFKIIGTPQAKLEALSRVTGGAKYTADLKVPGMLYGGTVRSTMPHAKILSIDTSDAERYPGVARIFTWKDIPGENAYGKRIRDQQVFCKDKVRFVGDAIALVVADTQKQAREAAQLVHITYEPLPHYVEPEDAMDPAAAKIHDKGNILYHYHLEKGDVEKGFAEADAVVERRYTTAPQDHAPIESEAAIAYYDDTGKLTVKSPGQSVFFDRLNIIRALGVPKEDVRVIQPAIGAAYGKREDIYAQIHAALAAFVLRKPVKIEWTREETLLATAKRTRQRTTIKMGVKKDGTITALEGRVVGDSGAYASWSVNIMRKAGVLVSGPYEIPNVKVDSYAVYTNTPLTGATRGFGAAETNFCNESHMDEAAHAIGMDPMQFRLKNALRKGGHSATDMAMDFYVPLAETIKECAKDFHWEEKRKLPRQTDSSNIRKGYGMASMWYGIGFGAGIEDTTDVVAELNEDGTATIYVGTVDYGNGSNTTFAMLAAECLGLNLKDIHMINADSDLTKNCGSTVATKQTYTTGNAVVRACLKIRKDMIEIAAAQMKVPAADVDLEFGYAVHLEGTNGDRAPCRDPQHRLPLSDVAKLFLDYGRPRRREGMFKAHELTAPLDPKTGLGKAWFPMAFGTQMAEVEVDTKRGKIKVNKIVAAHYVGRTINPATLRGQVVGGISMGVGMALWEDSKYGADGAPIAQNFDKYRLMRGTDAPEVKVIALELDEKSGPFGAIGVGEPPTIPVAAAIANAVYDAIGVRIPDLPLTQDKVLSALRAKTH